MGMFLSMTSVIWEENISDDEVQSWRGKQL